MTKIQARALRLLRDRVEFKTASFSLTPGHMSNDNDTDRIREATRVYVNSWVTPLIDALLEGDMRTLKVMTA